MKRQILVLGASAAFAPVLAGCGSTKTITVSHTVTQTVTQTETETVTAEAAAPAAPAASSDGTPSLATKPKKSGEVIFKGDGTGNVGPKKFGGGVYTARFIQYAPDDPSLNFRTDSSSIVIQLDQKPGVISATTVTVANATKKNGKSEVTIPAGKWYANVQADHSYVVRFTPAG